MLSSNVSTSRSTLKPPLGRMMGGWLSKDSRISSERQRDGGYTAPGCPHSSLLPGLRGLVSLIQQHPSPGTTGKASYTLHSLQYLNFGAVIIPNRCSYYRTPRQGKGIACLVCMGLEQDSPGWKVAGLSSSLGCQAEMQPTSITAWHWLSTRCSCAGLSAGNSARRDSQLIWARR